MEKLETEVSAKQKTHSKAQSDYRAIFEAKKVDVGELNRLEKQYNKV